jgi:hypothetical protein
MDSLIIIKSGAIFSSIGIAILVVFVVILLSFPVLKECSKLQHHCKFNSMAPGPLKSVVSPLLVVSALLTVSAGIAMIRVGIWYRYRHRT